jgi:hypothetical protein
MGLFKKCNFSWQKPRPRHRKADKEVQEKFQQELPLKVKEMQQKYPQAQVEVWF